MNSERAETPQQQPQGNLASAGAQLKAQREALGWPVEQVADQLKLAPRQVVALEEGDVAALPNLAVVRGFVRAYAKVVRLDAAPLVAMIEVHPPTPVHEASCRAGAPRYFGHVFRVALPVDDAALLAFRRVDRRRRGRWWPPPLLAPTKWVMCRKPCLPMATRKPCTPA